MKRFASYTAMLVVALLGRADALTQNILMPSGDDDMERRINSGTPQMDAGSSDLEFGKDGARPTTVGLRFTNVNINSNATINSAYIQFTADEASDLASDSIVADSDFIIRGELSANAPAYLDDVNDMPGRALTTATAPWSDVPAFSENARTINERTPDLAALLTEIIAQPGWAAGNAVAFQVVGDNVNAERTVYSSERAGETFNPSFAPELVIDFTPATSVSDWTAY